LNSELLEVEANLAMVGWQLTVCVFLRQRPGGPITRKVFYREALFFQIIYNGTVAYPLRFSDRVRSKEAYDHRENGANIIVVVAAV
jgi:hypothetical protein